jgi:hypothetical protein
LLCAGSAFAADSYSVLYHEALTFASTANQSDGFQETLSFDAFGRRFILAVKRNQRLHRRMTDGNIEFLRGKIRGAPGSWVRLMRRGNEISGMIRAAGDVYIIEPRTRIVGSLLDPGLSGDATNIIYRLADTVIPAGALGCGTRSGITTANAQTAFDQIVTELRDVPTLNALGAMQRITVGVLGDSELVSLLGESGATASILDRFNIVDGIYTGELGIEIVVDSVNVFPLPSFSPTTNSSDLLDEVRAYRNDNGYQRGLGLTHLVTGKQLDNNIAGIAFVGTPPPFATGVCSESGASLTENAASTTFSALLIAHEIGHNFGAPHDGEPGSPCESTPTNFLMAATIDGSSDEFSTCSKNAMQPVIDAASCLIDIAFIDLTLSPPLEIPPNTGFSVATGAEFSLSYEILNSGTEPASDIVAQFQVPPSFTITALSVAGGQCVPVTGRCTIGNLGTGQAATVVATLSGDVPGTFPIVLDVTAPGEIETADNQQSVSILVVMQPDLQVDMPDPMTLSVGESRQVSVTVVNQSTVAATNVQVDLLITPGLRIANLNSLNPDVLCTEVSCGIASLPGLGSVQMDFNLTGELAGHQNLEVNATANEPDVNPNDNAGNLSVVVAAPAVDGGGGGGAMHWAVLSMLMLVAGCRRRSRIGTLAN